MIYKTVYRKTQYILVEITQKFWLIYTLFHLMIKHLDIFAEVKQLIVNGSKTTKL